MYRLLVLLCCFAAAQAAEFRPASPEQAGIDPDRLKRVSRLLEQAVESGEIPGAVALVARKGNIVYHESFGHADIQKKEPMRKDSIFRIASMTKAITSIGVMVLYEQGRFLLNDPVSKYLPEFKNPKVLVKTNEQGGFVTEPAKREITIRDLLTHTSGIGYPFGQTTLKEAFREGGVIDGFTAEPLVLADVMRKLAKLPLLHHPGEKWTYGLNDDVLGYLIEVVSGQTLDQFFRKELFEPLRMNDTYFYLPKEKHDRLVTLYTKENDGRFVPDDFIETFNADSSYPIKGARSYFSGGAGLSSTANDYARFLQMLVAKGSLEGRKVLSRKSVDLIRAAHFEEFGGDATDFTLGFSLIRDLGAYGELGSEGAYSWGGAFNTSFWIDPNEQMIAVLMCQTWSVSTDIANRFRMMVYQALD